MEQKDSSVNEWRGWIQKQGSVVPSWKKRYLVLSGQRISYYDKEVSNPRAKEKGSFVLAGVQPNKSHDNCMTLMSSEGKAMNITTKTVGEYVMCKNAMENAIALHRSRVSAPPVAAAAGEYRSSSAVRSEQSSVGSASPSPYDYRSSNENLRSPPQPSSYQQSQYQKQSQQPSPYQQSQYQQNQYQQQPQQPKQNPYSLRSQSSSASDSFQQQYRQQQQQQVMQSRPTYTGWLEKEGEMVKSWKLRYFVLRDLDIAYYDKIDGNQKGGGRLVDMVVTEHGLQFHLDSGRIVNIRATSAADLQGWHDAVSQVMGRPTVDITTRRPSTDGAQFRRQSSSAPDKPLSAFIDKYVSTAVVASKVTEKFNSSVEVARGLSAAASQKVATAYENSAPLVEAAKEAAAAIPVQAVVQTVFTALDIDADVEVPSDDGGALESMTPEIVADFTSQFSMGDLPSPPPAAPQKQPSNNGLWLQKGGATYVADSSAQPTILPTRDVIATDVVPPPRPQQPLVRNTSSDDLKAQLWVISPKATPVVQPPVVPDVVAAPKKQMGVALPGMTGGAVAGNGGGSKLQAFLQQQNNDQVQPATAAPIAATPIAAAPIAVTPVVAAPVADSGLWIQKGGATYVPDESAVPTVIPTRDMIAPDVAPPVSKGPIVRTSSSDDLKAKLWVAPPSVAASAAPAAPVRGMGSSPVRPQQTTPSAPRGFGSVAVPAIVTPSTAVAEVEVVVPKAAAAPAPVVPKAVEPAPVVEVTPEVVQEDATLVVSDKVPRSAKATTTDAKKQTPPPKGCCTIM